MSFEPCPPGRSLEKNSRCPSRETAGAASKPGPFTLGPRLTGSPHGALSDARRETQMSAPPSPPERVETKYRLSSSGDSAAFISLAAELIGAPRFTGSDHSELEKDMASSLGAAGWDSGAQASRVRQPGSTNEATDAVRIGLLPGTSTNRPSGFVPTQPVSRFAPLEAWAIRPTSHLAVHYI